MKQIDTKQLAKLLRQSYKLDCLEVVGVDNWEGYDYSLNNTEDTNILSYHDYAKQSDEELTKNYKSSDSLELFAKLPYLAVDESEKIVLGSKRNEYPYIPTLYYYDEMYIVDWVCEEQDSIHSETGDTPEEAIQNAYDWCITNKFIKND